ncbi:tyrosine-type recombinase/integrase [bacterium]|nr:tyrosine-type recombinase/integrase [bacterium]
MATIFKRGKTWYIDYRQNGERVQRSLGVHSKRLAELKKGEIELNIERGVLGLGKRVGSSAEAFESFQAEIVDKKSPPWQKRMEQLFRPFRTWVLERPDQLVVKLSASDIEKFLSERRKQISDKTLNEELAIIKRFFQWAVDREYLAKNPAAKIDRYKQAPKAVRTFTPEELGLIWKHATPTQLPFYQMLLFTGLRDGELRNLEWNDVDLNCRQINVRIKQDWKPKTGRGRVIPVGLEAFELLSTRERRGRYVFTTSTGKRWVPPRQPWVDLLGRILDKEGVDLRGQVSIHTFRHTFATTCLTCGIDIKTVSEILGHTSVKMTERYLHLMEDHKAAAIKKVSFGQLVPTARILPTTRS